jgi:acetyl esterase/lipase
MLSWQGRIVKLYLNYKKATAIDHNAPVEVLRKVVEEAARFGRFPQTVQSQAIVIDHIPAEWLIPAQTDSHSAMLYLHGGAYIAGSIKSYRATAGQIAEAGKIRTLLIEYRLAPEYPFPAALQDALLAYEWLQRNGYKKIIIAGDSAGGGLSLATVISLRSRQALMPELIICISPWLDLEPSGESMITNASLDPMLKKDDFRVCRYYIGQNDPHDPLISPLYADFTGFPAIALLVGSDELLLSDSTRLAGKAKEAGVDVQIKIWEGMWHVFTFFAPFLPEATQAIAEIGDMIRRQMD